ncbi:hypothetical protein ACE193_25410 (plasmid) [Bernardetia sp. OM2101]|uniref:hypothetical protein n=1 Tax=Bernardetia sp. OM2101 TaxID=3344876 RepID=UPI0035CF8E78
MQRLLIAHLVFIFSLITLDSFAQNSTSGNLPIAPIKQVSSRTQQLSLLVGGGYIPNANQFFTSSLEYSIPNFDTSIEKQKTNLLTQINLNFAYNRYLIGGQQTRFNLFATFQVSTNKFGQVEPSQEHTLISYSVKNFIPMNLSFGLGGMWNTKYVSWFGQLQTASLNEIPSTLSEKYNFPISFNLGAMLPLPRFSNKKTNVLPKNN